MNIYNVKFNILVEIDEEGNIVENDEIEGEMQEVDAMFDLGARSLGEAFLLASEHLEKSVGQNSFEITGVELRKDIMLANWPGGDECQCLACRTERAAEEDRISFDCICRTPISVVNDFVEMECPACGKKILRDRIIGNADTGYIMMDIDKNE